jgi:4-hydroxybenzoyl-CoA thioesterase
MSDFVRHILVHWSDCDPARIVFHAHFVRWMDEGFTELARARGVDFAALQAAEPRFRGSPLVAVSCSFRAPARFGDTLEHRIATPLIGSTGKAFVVRHRFLKDGVLVANGEQTRIWAMAADNGEGLAAVPVPVAIAVLLRGEGT